jgi:hypothetical protein
MDQLPVLRKGKWKNQTADNTLQATRARARTHTHTHTRSLVAICQHIKCIKVFPRKAITIEMKGPIHTLSNEVIPTAHTLLQGSRHWNCTFLNISI